MADLKDKDQTEDTETADESLDSDFKAESTPERPSLEAEEEEVEVDKAEDFSAPEEKDFTDPNSVGEEFGPIKRPPLSQELRSDREEVSYNFSQPLANKRSSNKKTIVLLVALLLLVVGGFFLLRNQPSVKNLISSATPTPSPTSTPAPTEEPKTLDKSQWSLEVLNGSGKSGYAKQIADQIKALGYPVVKVGNADNQNYDQTQVLVKAELAEDVELVIADLKDIIKVASYGGQLKEGTASARIIIGKDSL